MSGIFAAGIGVYLPQRVVKNDDMAKLVETSDEWITQRTGIRERRFSNGEPNFYMGKMAALEALSDAGVAAEEIDMIIGSTNSPDYYFPTLSCIVQGEIGAKNAFCFDMSAACTGFVYALDVARNYLMAGEKKTILIICSENMSKLIDFTDRRSCVLFGDGAAAVVVRKDENRLYQSYLRSDGSSGGYITSRALHNQKIFDTDEDHPEYLKFEERKGFYMHMDGKDVYRFAVTALPEAIEKACEKAGLAPNDLDLIIPHQANIRIIQTASERLKVDISKMYINIDRYANTSCVSIPLCLNELKKSGGIKRGDKIGIVAFGAGLTYGAAVLEW